MAVAFLQDVFPKQRIRRIIFHALLVASILVLSAFLVMRESASGASFKLWAVPVSAAVVFAIFVTVSSTVSLLQEMRRIVLHRFAHETNDIRTTPIKNMANALRKLLRELFENGIRLTLGLIIFGLLASAGCFVIAGIIGLLNFGINQL